MDKNGVVEELCFQLGEVVSHSPSASLSNRPPPCHLHPQKSCSTSACPWNSMEQLTSGRNLSTEQMAHIQNPGPLELRGILAYIEAQPHPSCSAEIR